jgi:molecular chaperone IbpA
MASGYPQGSPHDWHQEPFLKKAKQEPTTFTQITLPSLFNDMFFLGFQDQLSRWQALTNVKKPTSFPPYNIIKVSDTEYTVELAVAGYTKEDIDIVLEKDQLTVSSKETETENKTMIHQGIAERQWSQKFFLGEYMEVTGATMKDGLLTITVERQLPEELKPKTIKIK